MNYFAHSTISRRAALQACLQFCPACGPTNNQRGDMRSRSVYAPVLASAEHRILRTIVHALCYGQTIAILRFMNRKTFSRPRDQEVLMRDQAYLYIQRKILAGDLQAGKAVSELTIAKELGSSRTPIREALGQLVAEGLLEQIPNRGAVVVQFGRQDIIDLFELREALEAYAVEKVAR